MAETEIEGAPLTDDDASTLGDSSAPPAASADPAEDDEALSPSDRAKIAGERIRAAVDREPPPEPDPVYDHPLAEIGATPITDEDAGQVGLHVCPMCAGWGGVDPDKALAALDALVEQVAPFPQSTVFERCDECNGWGSVLTGARRSEPGIQPCPTCNGTGYKDRRQAPTSAGVPPAPAAPPAAFAPSDYPDPMRLSPAAGGEPPAVGMVWDGQRGSWLYPTAG